jgi:AcrR family transcriptional regulator
MPQIGPVSRRNRPAKPALSQESIVDVALALMDADGLDGVTMRRVAQKLDTGPASLYVYVQNRDDLLRLVFDRVAGEVVLPADEPDGDWREQLVTLIEDAINILARHQDVATLALGDIPTGPNALGLTNAMVMLLSKSGVSRLATGWAVDLLALYITSAGMEAAMPVRQPTTDETANAFQLNTREIFGTASVERYPYIRDLSEELTSGTDAQRRRWMIQVLLNGILATAPEL